MNYNEEFNKIIDNLNDRKTILLHSCCAPCSSYVISKLIDYFDITILYYNPNIEPMEEYEKRKKEQIRFINELNRNIKILDTPYDNELYREKIKGLENLPEGGKRCNECIKLRLIRTINKALENNFDYFGTTLTVSPHKNSKLINELGIELSKGKNIKYLISDFKKENGYIKSIEIAKQYNLYRQNYCGCLFTRKEDINE